MEYLLAWRYTLYMNFPCVLPPLAFSVPSFFLCYVCFANALLHPQFFSYELFWSTSAVFPWTGVLLFLVRHVEEHRTLYVFEFIPA